MAALPTPQDSTPGAANGHGKSGGDQEAEYQRQYRPIIGRPSDADALTGPERTERAEQHADRKFEGVFRNQR